MVSKAFRKQSAHSLHSPEDEVEDGLHDLSAETLGIVKDQATQTVDLLDEGHVRILSLVVLSTSGRFPQVVEFGFSWGPRTCSGT